MKNRKLALLMGVFLALIISISLFIFACGGETATETPTPAATSTPTAAPTTSTPSQPASSPEVKPIELKYQTFLPENNIRTVAEEQWLKQIEELSGGKVKFTSYYACSLFPREEEWVNLLKGTVDITTVSAANQPQYFPMTVFLVPACYGAPIEVIFEVCPLIDEAIPESAAEWADVKTLNYFLAPGVELHTKTPVRTIADLKGMRLMVGTQGIGMAEGAGATPIAMPTGEIYTSADKGVIDGAIAPLTLLQSHSLAEVFPTTTILDYTVGAHIRLAMNMDSWNSLPADVQKIINDTMPDFRQNYFDMAMSEVGDATAAVLAAGHEFIELPPEDLDTLYEYEYEYLQKNIKELDEKGLPGTSSFAKVRELIEVASEEDIK